MRHALQATPDGTQGAAVVAQLVLLCVGAALCLDAALTAEVARALLRAAGTELDAQGLVLRHAEGFAAEVHPSCTAALPAALLLAALLVPPYWTRAERLRWMVAALGFIWCANQIRLVGAIWVGVHQPQHFGWVHGALAPAWLLVTGALFIAAAWRSGFRR